VAHSEGGATSRPEDPPAVAAARASRVRPGSGPSSPNAVFLTVFAALTGVWMVWWIGLYPGILSPDSLDQWAQALTFHFNNWHPYLYTLMLSGLAVSVRSPSLMGLLQIVVTAALIAAIARFAYARGVKGGWLAVVVAVYALHPQFGSLTVTIWKDVLFSALLLAEGFLVYLIVVRSSGTRAERGVSGTRASDDTSPSPSYKGGFWWPYVLIGLIAGASVSIRVNGIVNLVLPAALLLLFSAAPRKRIAALAATGLVTYVFFGVMLFNALHVEPAFLQFDQLRLKFVGAIYHLSDPKTHLTAQERKVFEGMMPARVWSEAYTPKWSNDLYFKQFLLLPQVKALTPQNISSSRFYANWTHAADTAALHNPGIVLEDRILQAGWVLGTYYHAASFLTIYEPDLAELRHSGYPDVASITPPPRLRGLRSFLTRVLEVSSGNGVLGEVLWAPGWVIVAYIGMLVWGVRRRLGASVIFISFILLNALFVTAIAPASDYRYLYFANLAVFATPLLVAAEVRSLSSGATPWR
jgi:hypothetical protein